MTEVRSGGAELRQSAKVRQPAAGLRAGRADVGERTDEIARVLELARRHLRSDVAWLARFSSDRQVVDLISGHGDIVQNLVGRELDRSGSYCVRVLDGRLPSVVPDARADSRTAELTVTRELGIGSYVGVPVYLSDGEFYGMLCALSTDADPELDEEDARFLSLLAEVLKETVTAFRRDRADDDHVRSAVEKIIVAGGPTMVFQPVFDLPTQAIVGAEALARFPPFPAPEYAGAPRAEPDRWQDLPPAQWFAYAESVGLGIELELAAVRAALAALPRFPRGLSIAVNASPATIASGRLAELLDESSADQVVLEVTEREGIQDLPLTLGRLGELRDRGIRIAVDNVGVAYASLRRLVQLLPDVVKMDRWLSTDVRGDTARRALVEALVHFSRQIGATLVAEGVETAEEMRALVAAGVDQGQGEFLAPPGPLPLPVHARCRPVPRAVPLAARAMA